MFSPSTLIVLVGSLVALGPAPAVNNPAPGATKPANSNTPANASAGGNSGVQSVTPPATTTNPAPAPNTPPAATPAPTPPASEPQPTNPSAKPARKGPLMPGDAAPTVVFESIVKGPSITGLAKGKVYVIDFWASWAGECRPVFSHLSQLQSQYSDKQLSVIGVSSEDAATVRAFIEKLGDEVNYTIAVDKLNATDTKWMRAANRNELPTAFIVDRNGNIAWIGHPFEIASPLAQVIDGSFDASKFAATQAKIKALRDEASKFFRTGVSADYNTGMNRLDQIVELDPTQATSVGTMKLQVLLMGKKDYPAAYALAKQLGETSFAKDKNWLNSTAWMIVEAPGLGERDLALATALINRAGELTKWSDAEVLDTAARVKWALGDKAGARELQGKAVQFASDERKPELQQTLEKYSK